MKAAQPLVSFQIFPTDPNPGVSSFVLAVSSRVKSPDVQPTLTVASVPMTIQGMSSLAKSKANQRVQEKNDKIAKRKKVYKIVNKI